MGMEKKRQIDVFRGKLSMDAKQINCMFPILTFCIIN